MADESTKTEQITDVQKGDPDFSAKHPLETKWTLWFDNPEGKQKQNHTQWGQTLRAVYTFGTVEDFWCLYNNIIPPSRLSNSSDMHLFREGIEPKWEDPACEHGGKWTAMLSKNNAQLLDSNWLHAVLACIGEQFDDGDEVCGVVVNIRPKSNRISIWTKTASNEAAQVAIGKQLKEIFGIPDNVRMGFLAHSDAKRDDKKAKDRYSDINRMRRAAAKIFDQIQSQPHNMHSWGHTTKRTPTNQPCARIKTFITCRASGTSAASNTTTSTRSSKSPFTSDTVFKQLQELNKLAQEATELALSTGPRGIRRTAQAAEAFLSVGRDQLQRFQTNSTIDAPAAVLRQLFEKLGATYIKLGQFIASSPTLFPAEYVEEFQKCLDQTPSVPFATVRKTIEQDLGCSLEDIFESVDVIPLASASIAQVHSAILKGSRRDVVIKVLKPGVEDTLTTDLNFLYIASRALEVASPGVSRASLSSIMSDIRTSMLQEVDFRQEALHVEHFATYLDATGLRAVATCPQLYRQYCTKRVLVMERLKGASLTDLDAVRKVTSADPEGVLINALNVWLGSVVGAETFHADVHAGNVLVLPDGRVGFIDFGIVGKISQTTWRAVEALLKATAVGDYDTMARALVTVGATDTDVDLDAFARDLKELFVSLQAVDTELIVSTASGGVTASVAADDAALNKFLIDLVRVGEDNGVKFPREFALLIKQILYFDRYTRLLAPTLKVFDDERINLKDSNGFAWDWDSL